MQYVIWGCGRRGKRVFDLLGEGRVIAFIDSNEKLFGTSMFGKPVISYESYKRRYKGCPVIISMHNYETVVAQLQSEPDIPYFVLAQQPPECTFRYDHDCFPSLPFDYDSALPCIFYGMNFIGMEIIGQLDGNAAVYVVLPRTADVHTRTMLKTLFPMYFRDTLPAQNGGYNLFLAEPAQSSIEDDNCHVYNLFDFSRQFVSYRSSTIAALKNKFAGKRCFIVATGPSLRMSDLDLLHANGEYCISMNRIFEAFSKTSWRPNLYLSADPLCIAEFYEQIKNLDAEMKFIGDICDDNIGFIPQFHLAVVDIYCANPPFSDDVSCVCYDGGTITYSCLQFAAYLGFAEIYLLGVDFSYNGVGRIGNHFYKRESGVNNPFLPELCLNAYKSAGRYAAAHGIKIYNATRGGELEVFERVDFDKLF